MIIGAVLTELQECRFLIRAQHALHLQTVAEMCARKAIEMRIGHTLGQPAHRRETMVLPWTGGHKDNLKDQLRALPVPKPAEALNLPIGQHLAGQLETVRQAIRHRHGQPIAAAVHLHLVLHLVAADAVHLAGHHVNLIKHETEKQYNYGSINWSHFYLLRPIRG